MDPRDLDPPSPWAPRPPSRRDIEQKFTGLLDGSLNRAAVDRWAAQWVAGQGDPGIRDDVVWWALTILCGIDLTHGQDQPYLHDDEQIAGWLEDFRRGRSE